MFETLELDNATEAAKELLAKSGFAFAATFASTSTYVAGAFPYLVTRDFGVKAATGGVARSSVSQNTEAVTEPTGWHYHNSQFQFAYFLRGSATIEFEDGVVRTFSAGDSVFLPGGFRHNELCSTADKISLEFSMPGEIASVPCERPEGLPDELVPMPGPASATG